jgi:hypothetical protein
VASAIIEGSANLDFIAWSAAALVMAAPVVLVQDKQAKARRVVAARQGRR